MISPVEPATKQMEQIIAKDKLIREEVLIPAVSKKFTLLLVAVIFVHFRMGAMPSTPDEESV